MSMSSHNKEAIALARSLLVSHLGLVFSSIRYYRDLGARPPRKADPRSPLQASVEPDLVLYCDQEWIDMSRRKAS